MGDTIYSQQGIRSVLRFCISIVKFCAILLQLVWTSFASTFLFTSFLFVAVSILIWFDSKERSCNSTRQWFQNSMFSGIDLLRNLCDIGYHLEVPPVPLKVIVTSTLNALYRRVRQWLHLFLAFISLCFTMLRFWWRIYLFVHFYTVGIFTRTTKFKKYVFVLLIINIVIVFIIQTELDRRVWMTDFDIIPFFWSGGLAARSTDPHVITNVFVTKLMSILKKLYRYLTAMRHGGKVLQIL